MKVMVMIEGSGADEDKITPTEEMFREMGAYNEQLVQAGIMLDGQGLHPTSKGARVVFEGGSTTVVDGPFTESKEIIAGYWLWEVSSLEEAVEWAKRCPTDPQYGARQVLEVRPIFSAEDFGAEYTDDLAAQDARLAEEIKARHGARRNRLGQLRSGGPGARHPSHHRSRLADGRTAPDRHARSAGPRCRTGRGAGPGRVRAGPGAVAGARHPGQPRRLADRDGQAQGDRRDPAGAGPGRQVRPVGGRVRPDRRPGRIARSRGGRADRRRCARPDLRRLPSGAAAGVSGGADVAAAGRTVHRGDRPGVPGAAGHGRSADLPGQTDAGRGAGPVRGAGHRRAPGPAHRGAGSRLSDLQRGLLGHLGRHVGPPGPGRGGDAAGPAAGRAGAARGRGPRAGGPDGAAGVAVPGPARRGWIDGAAAGPEPHRCGTGR